MAIERTPARHGLLAQDRSTVSKTILQSVIEDEFGRPLKGRSCIFRTAGYAGGDNWLGVAKRMAKVKHAEICILYDARRLEGFSAFNFERLQKAIGGLCDLMPILHSPNFKADDFGLHLNDEQIFHLTPNQKTRSMQLVPGNCDLKIISAVRHLPAYEAFIRLEDDVFIGEPIEESVSRLIGVGLSTDFSASYLARKREDGWMWWDDVDIPNKIDTRPDFAIWKAFLPVMTVSRPFIKRYAECLAEGWSGHYEVLMATVAKNFNFSCVDISLSPLKLTAYPKFSIDPPSPIDLGDPPFVHPIKTSAEYMQYTRRSTND